MIQKSALVTSSLALSVMFLAGCKHEEPQAPAPAATTAAPVAAKPQPTKERLVERCKERWAKIEKKDWVSAYDMLAPEPKQALMLSQFLSQKASHEYTDPKIAEVLRIDGEVGYVRTTALWTPHHPQLELLKDPESLAELKRRFPEKIDQVETWRFADGDWCWLDAKGVAEFFEKHPELLRAQESAPAANKPG